MHKKLYGVRLFAAWWMGPAERLRLDRKRDFEAARLGFWAGWFARKAFEVRRPDDAAEDPEEIEASATDGGRFRWFY